MEKLSKQQMSAILLANYKEIDAVFEQLAPIPKFKKDKAAREAILTNLGDLLKAMGVDHKKENFYEILSSS